MTSTQGEKSGAESLGEEGPVLVNKAMGEELDIQEKVLIEEVIENVRDHPSETALRWKRLGVWKEFTWEEYLEQIYHFMLGLEDVGFDANDVLFTIGTNRPQMVWAWFSTQCLGGIPAPNYADMLPDDVATQINLTGARVALVEDQEMVDKLLSVKNDIPTLQTIIYRDTKGMFRYEEDDIELLSYENVKEKGEELGVSNYISETEARIESISPHDTAMLSPTSGTTGVPKRTKLSHHNFRYVAQAFLKAEPLGENADYFSLLPMAWIGEPVQLLAMAPFKRWTVNFAEEEETTNADLREIGPEFFLGSPSMYEGFVADIKAKIENTTRLKRFVYEKAMDIGNRYASYISGDNKDKDVPTSLRILHNLAYWVAYRPILDKIGLKRAKKIYTGGAPLGEEHFQFYHALGLEIKQVWGQTETCGYVTSHRKGKVDVETTGRPLPGLTVGELDTGELVVRGASTTDGYYEQPEKTKETIENGWIHTDDFGTVTDDNQIKVFDRMDDVIEMEDLTTVAPISIETRLKFNPYIKEAMIIGDDRPFLTAILNIRYDNVAEWADQNDIQYTGYSDLSQHPEVIDLLSGIVNETNSEQNVPIERFVSLFKLFNPDDGEITQTGKLRRQPIKERYSTLLEGLYNKDTSEVELSLTVTYSDGRQDEQTQNMEIITVGEEQK